MLATRPDMPPDALRPLLQGAAKHLGAARLQALADAALANPSVTARQHTDAGTPGSAAAFSAQASDAWALVTLASSIRGSDAPALCMRVLVAVSVTAWAGASTAAGTARSAHVRVLPRRDSALFRAESRLGAHRGGIDPAKEPEVRIVFRFSQMIKKREVFRLPKLSRA
jgi:hypothetical protein